MSALTPTRSRPARTKNLRLGAMGFTAALHDPLRLVEEIAIADQMTGGRIEFGLVLILPSYFLVRCRSITAAVTLEIARLRRRPTSMADRST